MTQTAQVKQIFAGGIAEVAVTRQGACSHDCSECGGCATAVMATITARAQNRVGAKPGDMVVVETSSHRLLGTAALVYLMPMVLLIAGYLAAAALGLSEGLCMLAGAGCFALSIGAILLLDRYVKRHRSLEFSIIQIKHA